MSFNREYWLLIKTVTYGTCSVPKPCSLGVHLCFTLPQSGTKLTHLERLLPSESGNSAINIDILLSTQSGRFSEKP